ncbi:MAG: iron ABC transporter substrate-binding protein [Anaerolineae bacterium]|nr:iron ABC transporter substrate-binding protein [Anaerolineae bacterium]
MSFTRTALLLPVLAALLVTACAASPDTGDQDAGVLIVYSGRNEELVGPLIEQFEAKTGIDVRVRYGDTAELAATILEEGANSPADVFYGQDAGALGALAEAGLATPLPEDTLNRVGTRFRSEDGLWVGTSGRARVLVYNPELLSEDELPTSIHDLTDPVWKGRIGWAPTNGSFQAFVTAMRVIDGEDATRAWLEGILANEPVAYSGNSAALQGVAAGEVEVALINHYYLMQELANDPAFNAANYFFAGGDPGGLVNVAGVAIMKNASNAENAQRFTDYLLSDEAQEYFRDTTYEYPLVSGISANDMLPPLDTLSTPDIDLSSLSDLSGTLTLLQETGALD